MRQIYADDKASRFPEHFKDPFTLEQLQSHTTSTAIWSTTFIQLLVWLWSDFTFYGPKSHQSSAGYFSKWHWFKQVPLKIIWCDLPSDFAVKSCMTSHTSMNGALYWMYSWDLITYRWVNGSVQIAMGTHHRWHLLNGMNLHTKYFYFMPVIDLLLGVALTPEVTHVCSGPLFSVPTTRKGASYSLTLLWH